jgi:hypothetical protein
MADNYEELKPENFQNLSNQHTEIISSAKQYYARYKMHEMGVIYS